MFITLSYFDVMEAIQKHLKDKNIEWKHNEFDDTWIEFSKPVWEVMKHKNGKVVMNEHGYPKREIVKWEKLNENFSECDEMRIWYTEETEETEE